VNGEQGLALLLRTLFTVPRMRLLQILALIALIGLAGCGKKSETSKATASADRRGRSTAADDPHAAEESGFESSDSPSSIMADEQSLLDRLPTLPIPEFSRQSESGTEPESEPAAAEAGPRPMPQLESNRLLQDRPDAAIEAESRDSATWNPGRSSDEPANADANPLRSAIGRLRPTPESLNNPLRDSLSAGASIRRPRSTSRWDAGAAPPKSGARLLAPPLFPDSQPDAEAPSESTSEPGEPAASAVAEPAPPATEPGEENRGGEQERRTGDSPSAAGAEPEDAPREAGPNAARAGSAPAARDAALSASRGLTDGGAASAADAAHSASSPPVAKSSSAVPGLNTVRVYYGTDRRQLSGGGRSAAPFVLGMVLAVISIVAASCIYSRRRKLALACAASGLALGGLLMLGAGSYLVPGPGSPRPTMAYGTERGSLQYGYCDVSIPPVHQPGNVERPSILTLEFREREDRHIVLQRIEPLVADSFFQEVRNRVRQSSRQDLFVFVHGYNVTFDAAARRTAQMAHDLEFDGAPIFFSWPSQGELSDYMVDETSVSWSAPHLKQFLLDVVTRSDARRVHLIAHSMGSRALASAVQELAAHFPAQPPLFNEVILAAPDIDADEFRNRIAPAIRPAAERITLYASSNDQALMASRLVHGYSRAGESGASLLILPGIETIDVSLVDHSILGHSYYGSSGPVLRDIQAILRGASSADSRPWLRAESLGSRQYWRFDPDRSIARRPN